MTIGLALVAMAFPLPAFSTSDELSSPAPAQAPTAEFDVRAKFKSHVAQFYQDLIVLRLQSQELRRLWASGRVGGLPGLAPQLNEQSRLVQTEWRELEALYRDAEEKNLDLGGINLRTFHDRQLTLFLACLKNDRINSGFSSTQLLRLWLGSHHGKVRPKMPDLIVSRKTLRSAQDGREVTVSKGDLMVATMVDGGILRGTVFGWIGKNWIISDYPSYPLTLLQRPKPRFRVLPLDHIAHFDVIRRSDRGHDFPPSLAATIDWQGRYLPWTIQPGMAKRVRLRPSDAEILRQIHSRVIILPSESIDIRDLDSATDTGPENVPLPFADCRSELGP